MQVDVIIQAGRVSEAERFWSKVARGASDECWLWLAFTDWYGYGRFGSGGRMVGAHRWSYMAVHGPIDSDVHVLHACDTPACVNPAHLFPGTQASNMADMAAKGRASRAARNTGEAHPLSRFTEEQIADIRRRYTGKRGEQAALAREFGVTRSAVHLIVKGVRWK